MTPGPSAVDIVTRGEVAIPGVNPFLRRHRGYLKMAELIIRYEGAFYLGE